VVARAPPRAGSATLVLLLGLLATYLAWRLSVEGTARTSGLAADLLFFPFYPVAGLAALLAARGAAGRARVAWSLAAAAWLLSTAGELLYLGARLSPEAAEALRFAGDLADEAYYPLLAAAFAFFVDPPRTGSARLRLLADGLVGATAVGALSWYFVLRHLPAGPLGRDLLEKVWGTGGGEALILFAASLALGRPRPGAGGASLALLTGGALTLAFGDLSAAEHTVLRESGSSIVGDLAIATGATLSAGAGVLARWPIRLGPWPERLWSALHLSEAVPSVAVASVLLLLGRELLTGGDAVPGVSVGLALLAILAMVRLWLARHDLELEGAARRAQEERLAQAQRLEVLGQLTAAVAHDFGNLVASMAGISSELADRLPEGDQELAHFDAAVARGRTLCRALLSLGRRTEPRRQRVDLRRLTDGITPLLRRLLPGDVDLTVTGDVGEAVVEADPTQLELALFNLAANARDAMPSGGTLWIRIDTVRSRGGGPARRARLTVADSGVGMAPATLDRAGEPFFTTKPEGKGTGLGLAAVRAAAEAAQGTFRIESTPGRGTIVALELPLVEEPAAARPSVGV
jgi:signal transduction histidine kinase